MANLELRRDGMEMPHIDEKGKHWKESSKEVGSCCFCFSLFFFSFLNEKELEKNLSLRVIVAF